MSPDSVATAIEMSTSRTGTAFQNGLVLVCENKIQIVTWSPLQMQFMAGYCLKAVATALMTKSLTETAIPSDFSTFLSLSTSEMSQSMPPYECGIVV